MQLMLLNIDNKIGIWSGGGLVDKFEVGDTVIIHNPKGKSTCNVVPWQGHMDRLDKQERIIDYIDKSDGTCRLEGEGSWFDLRWLERVDREVRDFGSDISLDDFFT